MSNDNNNSSELKKYSERYHKDYVTNNKQWILDNLKDHPNKRELLKLSMYFSKDVFDLINSSLVDLSDYPVVFPCRCYNVSRVYNVGFRIEEKDVNHSKSHDLLLKLFAAIDNEATVLNQFKEDNDFDGTIPGWLIKDRFALSDPRSNHNEILIYDKDCKWIDIGDYLHALHAKSIFSPWRIADRDILLYRNGDFFKPYEVITKDNLEEYLKELCKFMSSYSHVVTWYYRNDR